MLISVPPYGDMVSFRAMLMGYEAAVERFADAAQRKDPVQAFQPLFEALHWEVALDDRCASHWTPDGLPPVGHDWPGRLASEPDTVAVRGVRFARNRVHHQWADALRLDSDGPRYARRFPGREFEWVWHDIDKLPPAPANRRDQRGEDAYARLLAGQAAEFTLGILLEIYANVATLLEPPTPDRAQLGGYPGEAEDGQGFEPSIGERRP